LSGSARPDVSVVIVSWKVRDLLDRCLTTLRDAEPELSFETIVVDNDSRDGTLEMLAARHPEVVAVDAGANLGFSGGNNLGFRRARGRTVMMLNPDTEVSPRAVTKLLAALQASADLGIVGPKILLPSGKIQLPCARRFPTLSNQMIEILGLSHKYPSNPIAGHYRMSDWDHEDERDVEAVSGCCLLLRKELLDEMGGLDESYFMYGEDLDLCWRVRRSGRRIRYVPSAEILHYGEQSSSQNESPMFVETFESMHRFFRKNRGPIAAALYRAAIGGTSAAWIAVESARARLAAGERAVHLRARVIPMYRTILDWALRGPVRTRVAA
jgi:GT2 family glycosyltransferase